jgi:hypothetical protein
VSLEDLVYSRPFGRFLLYPVASASFRRFQRSGQTPSVGYTAMRKLYGNEDPSLFERLADLADLGAGSAPADPDGAVGLVADREHVVETLRRDGFCVLAERLSPQDCDELEAAALEARCSVVGTGGREPGRRRFDPGDPGGIRFDVDEADVVDVPAAQRLIADPSLFAVASEYLGTEPVQDLVAMWWSAAAPSSDVATSAAAQQFHFDLDRLRFVKVFVFLTDVTEQTGPHVYVRGTHRQKPTILRRDGRHADELVHRLLHDDVVSITGPRGTVFLADTAGLHKGLPLEAGRRLVFQTEYASSLFGAPFNRVEVRRPTAPLEAMVRAHPHSFARFSAAS